MHNSFSLTSIISHVFSFQGYTLITHMYLNIILCIYLCVETELHFGSFILNLSRFELLQVIIGHLQSLHTRLNEVQVKLHR